MNGAHGRKALPGYEYLGPTSIDVAQCGDQWEIRLAGMTIETGFMNESAALLRATGYVSYDASLVEIIAERVEVIQRTSQASSHFNAERIQRLNLARRREMRHRRARGEVLVSFFFAGFFWETVVTHDRDEATGERIESVDSDFLVSIDGLTGRWVSAYDLLSNFDSNAYEELVNAAITESKGDIHADV